MTGAVAANPAELAGDLLFARRPASWVARECRRWLGLLLTRRLVLPPTIALDIVACAESAASHGRHAWKRPRGVAALREWMLFISACTEDLRTAARTSTGSRDTALEIILMSCAERLRDDQPAAV